MKRIILAALLFAAPLLAQNFSSYNGLPVARPSWLHSERVSNGNLFQDPSLLGWWPLDHDTGSIVTDASGNLHNGTWSGTNTGTNGFYSQGVVGPYAGTFDGSTNYIAASSSSFLGLIGHAYSIGAWIKDDTSGYNLYVTSSHRIVSFADGTTNVQLGLVSNASANGRVFYIQENTIKVVTTAVSTGWNYVVATSDGAGTYHIYLNGALADNGSSAGPSTTYVTNTGYLYIGQLGNGGYVSGQVADVRIYNRVLAAAELLAIYNAEMPYHMILGPGVIPTGSFVIYTIAGPSSPGGATNSFSVTKTGSAIHVDWGDGTSSNSNTPSHTYTVDGMKAITVTSADGWSGLTGLNLHDPYGGYSPYTGNVTTASYNGTVPPPAGLSNLTNLQSFISCDTWFNGPIDFSVFPNLQHLDVQGNLFSGPFLLSSTALNYIDIHVTGLSGTLPSILGSSPGLVFFQSYKNYFQGAVPSFASSTGLTHLGLIDGGLSSSPAGSFATQANLTSLSFYNNCIGCGSNPYVGGGFSAAVVNQILADLVASLALPGRVVCTVNLAQWAAAPTGQGLLDKATLIAAGWTVTTD